jgi:drug/metabolite transporter (DMT)-like permease
MRTLVAIADTLHLVLQTAATTPQYTTVPLASLFASTAPLLLVLWKAVTGGGVTLVEGVGVGIAMTGSVLCALGPSDDDVSSGDVSSGDSPSSSSGSNSMLGILFATSAALATAIYIKVRVHRMHVQDVLQLTVHIVFLHTCKRICLTIWHCALA